MHFFLSNLALCLSMATFLIIPASARVARVRAGTKSGLHDGLPLFSRDDQVCGGNANMKQCGDAFPANFCCDTSATCLRLNTTSSVTAAICCPAGQDCSSISPVDCNQSSQDPSIAPASQLHSKPTVALQTCGDHCCPMGYDCRSEICVAALGLAAAPSSSAAPNSPSPTPSTGDTAKVSIIPATDSAESPGFSGSAFAAGFVPGIALGGLITAIAMIGLIRRRNRKQAPRNEKSEQRDTLTDLGPLGFKSTHNRSISEPIPNPDVAGRTDFLRSASSENSMGREWSKGTNVETPVRSPIMKALFSHSPFLESTLSSTSSSQSSLPNHMKRGTLSFKVTPVRALRKQRSVHSLRRQATSKHGRLSDDSSRHLHSSSSSSRGHSQETIKVVMRDPLRQFGPPITPPMTEVDPASSGRNKTNSDAPVIPQSSSSPPTSPYASSSRYPTQYGPPPNFEVSNYPPPPFLGAPYTPTRTNHHMLHTTDRTAVSPFSSRNRDTTFSALMERAGLRKSELVMGPRK